jgi:hypothetical protein
VVRLDESGDAPLGGARWLSRRPAPAAAARQKKRADLRSQNLFHNAAPMPKITGLVGRPAGPGQIAVMPQANTENRKRR